LTNIPNGVYELRAQGFFRYGSATLASTYREKDDERLQATLYANEASTPLMSIFEHADHNSIPSAESATTKSGTIPSTMNAASAMFSADLYKNKLLVEVADGTLRIGVKKTTTSPTASWTVFDNFRLYYLGTEMPSAIEHISPEKAHGESESIYDLTGRRLVGMPRSKGIYIINGKKRLVK
jgi:hypothetical protein